MGTFRENKTLQEYSTFVIPKQTFLSEFLSSPCALNFLGRFRFYFLGTFFGIWPWGVESLLSDFLSGADDADVDDDDELCPPFLLALMTLTPWSILPVINVIVLAKGSHTGLGRQYLYLCYLA